MARATLPGSGIDWDAFEGDYNLIRDKIEAVFPKLFADFNARIRVPGGFHLYNGPRNREWNTANGRANFLVCAGVAEDPEVEIRRRCSSRRSAAMTSTIPRSTASTIVIAAFLAAGWWSS